MGKSVSDASLVLVRVVPTGQRNSDVEVLHFCRCEVDRDEGDSRCGESGLLPLLLEWGGGRGEEER